MPSLYIEASIWTLGNHCRRHGHYSSCRWLLCRGVPCCIVNTGGGPLERLHSENTLHYQWMQSVFWLGKWRLLHHLTTLSPPAQTENAMYSLNENKEFPEWRPCQASNLSSSQYSRTAVWHRTWKTMEVVALPTTVIFSFCWNPRGMTHMLTLAQAGPMHVQKKMPYMESRFHSGQWFPLFPWRLTLPRKSYVIILTL